MYEVLKGKRQGHEVVYALAKVRAEGSFGRMYKHNFDLSVLVMLVLVVLVIPRLFLMHHLVWCIKKKMHLIISKISKIPSTNVVEYVLRGNGVFNHVMHALNTLALVIS